MENTEECEHDELDDGAMCGHCDYTAPLPGPSEDLILDLGDGL